MSIYASDGRELVLPPITLNDAYQQAFVENINSLHKLLVQSSVAFNISANTSAEYEERTLGRLGSVVAAVFGSVFGQPPADRYADIFEQVSIFAEHLAQDHIFADGNKRTALRASVAFLEDNNISLTFSDSPDPSQNEMYQWIQDVVQRKHTVNELAAFLRQRAQILY